MDKTKHWYAMSSPYGREAKVIDIMEQETDVEAFVPMERYERMVGQKNRVRKISERPVVRNLLFINAEQERMRELKSEYNTLIQYKTQPMEGGVFRPIIVPDKQMEDFMRLYENPDAELQFFNAEEIDGLNLRPNAKVRIEDGIFAGIEGYFQRVKGANKKRLVVKIEGFLACAAFLTECKYVKLVE